MKYQLIVVLSVFFLSFSFLQSITHTTLPAQSYPQHGFLAGTLVKVPGGYKAIEELALLDTVLVRNEHGEYEERTILRISRIPVSKYIKIVVGNEKICAGCDQQFYIDNQWITAAEMCVNPSCHPPSRRLQLWRAGCVNGAPVLVHHVAFVHALCVEGQTFCVTPYDISVHNSNELAVSTAAVFVIESLITIHPISVLIGSTVALATIGYALYEKSQQNNIAQSEVTHVATVANQNALQERTYYYARKKVLVELKQDFINIQKALEMLQNLNDTNCTSFTYRFLQSIKPQHFAVHLEPFADEELHLFKHQKNALRKQREAELLHLEQEIQDVQITLAFHFCELINRVERAIKEHNEEQKNVNAAIAQWNALGKKPSIKVARDLYELYFGYEEIVDNFEQCNRELQLIIEFYKNPCNATVLKNSTDIARLLHMYDQAVAKNIADILSIRSSIAKNTSIVEKYLNSVGIRAALVRNAAKEKAQRKRSDAYLKHVADAAKRRLDFKPPKKPDDDKDKKERVTEKAANMYEVFAKFPVGKLLQQFSRKTKHFFRGAVVYQAINKIVEYGIKAEDYFYLDTLHRDHIEVFCSTGNMLIRTVLNLDGTQNLDKLEAAIAHGRNLLEIMK